MMTLPVGTRVKRGPDWKWGDQDWGADYTPGLGTVVELTHTWARFNLKVLWDNGLKYYYEYNEKVKHVVPLTRRPLKDFL